ncbi:tautomerase family protein [Bacillus tianshenii]|nr:tautomerase family protein [Bacillus tianshenii]
MPVISIKLAKGRTEEQKALFASEITKNAVELLGVKAEWVTVLFEEYERENWATAGMLHSKKFGPGFGLKGTEKKS